MSNKQTVKELFFIDDSLDEHQVTKLLLRKSKIAVEFRPFQTTQDFNDQTAGYQDAEWLRAIVVFDLNLTLGSGIAALKTFKQNHPKAEIIAGICTGSADPKDRLDAMEAGASFFVTKPLNFEAIQSVCNAVPDLTFENDVVSGLIRILR